MPRADNPTLAHLLKYDSCYGAFPGEVAHNDRGLEGQRQTDSSSPGTGWANGNGPTWASTLRWRTTGKLKDRAAPAAVTSTAAPARL